MDQQKRLFVTLGLSFALIFLFQKFVWGPELEREQARAAALDAGTPAAPSAPVVVEATDGGPSGPVMAAAQPVLDADGGVALVPAAPAVPVEVPLRTVELPRATTRLAFTSEGGSISSAELVGEREREEQMLNIPDGYKKLMGGSFPPPPHINLATPPAQGPGHFAVSISGASELSARQRYQVDEEAPGRIVFSATHAGWKVKKTFTWDSAAAPLGLKSTEKGPAGYTMQLDVQVTNTSGAPQAGELTLHTSRAITPEHEQKPSMFGGIGNQATVVCRVGDDLKRRTPDDDKPPEEHKGAVHFVAIDQTYFLSAAWPKGQSQEGRCVLTARTPQRQADLVLPLTVQAGETVTRSYGLFLGPKDMDLLLAVERAPDAAAHDAAPHPGLERTVDFGLWAVICKALNFFLRFFHGLIGNWGLSIIALTVMVKLVLLPLTHKAMVSAEEMKKLQPRMEAIKKKYPEDRDRQNQETMKLYQEAKVNPLGGCLPLLVQLPIWGALFTTLRTSYELYQEPFYGVWSDLTSKDPTYLLPLALGVTMIITQRLQPQMMDQSQAFMMTWIMPVFFTAMMMNYPAGLALYIFTNNLLSIVQQYLLRKYLASKSPPPAPA